MGRSLIQQDFRETRNYAFFYCLNLSTHKNYPSSAASVFLEVQMYSLRSQYEKKGETDYDSNFKLIVNAW